MSSLPCDISLEPSCQKFNSSANPEIDEAIAELQQSQEFLYQSINLEVWALVETMDRFVPGFWSRFLDNRRKALKQFIQQKRSSKD